MGIEKAVNNFILLLTLKLLTSCTTLSFKSYGEYSIFLGPKKGHGEIQEYVGEKDFYLWGVIPFEHTVYIDNVMKEFDFYSIANVEVEEYQSFKNFVLSVLSLGLYVPRNYKVKFYGKR
tara:strand:- start:997 stop:1353 length:357 start_codon:yes stop_codon:yes gene_type:complete